MQHQRVPQRRLSKEVTLPLLQVLCTRPFRWGVRAVLRVRNALHGSNTANLLLAASALTRGLALTHSGRVLYRGFYLILSSSAGRIPAHITSAPLGNLRLIQAAQLARTCSINVAATACPTPTAYVSDLTVLLQATSGR